MRDFWRVWQPPVAAASASERALVISPRSRVLTSELVRAASNTSRANGQLYASGESWGLQTLRVSHFTGPEPRGLARAGTIWRIVERQPNLKGM